MNTVDFNKSVYLGYITFASWMLVTYIVPKISDKVNQMYYDYLQIDLDNDDLDNIDLDNDDLDNDLDNDNNITGKIEIITENELHIKNDIIKLDHSLTKKINENKNSITDLQDRVHGLEDQLNTLISNISNSIIITE
jgi:hypothetical protein